MNTLRLRIAILAIQLCAGIALLATLLGSLPAYARAGTLLKCEGVSTQQGYKYVGIYCADYECKYTIVRMFDSWCPYTI